MSKRQYPVEMANLVCKFGARNLLDYFEEIVYPAFSDPALRRVYSETKYFFENVELVTVDGRVLLVGRFIKDMIFEREQVYTSSGLVADHDEMQSSPSCIFVLVLDIHRLIFLKETKGAPNLDNFKSTLENFLKVKYKLYIDSVYDDAKERKEKVTKKQLMLDNVSPTLELIPLTSAQSIDSFVRQYQVLSSVTYKFSDRNDEHDNEGFFEAVQRQKDEVGSKTTTIKHSNSEGLDKESVIEEVQAATVQGNQKVTLVGKDSSGTELRGDNENFQLKSYVELTSTAPSQAAPTLFQKFIQLVGDGMIQVAAPTQAALAKLNPYRR
ncbi:hypothetical protein OO306_20660 [Pseudomonas sp. DCB_AW]|uniref:hypothetical protein n=1 Tax=Pseudomonas sp. DCB_AW TaxID=2993596 RepID=UPI0022494AA2|nr:hypothetical protein [Pseudomonas sp. DCB_AW]MCX2687949.1 hypothetical protein [Pseudomonas sp. DCB_AW]